MSFFNKNTKIAMPIIIAISLTLGMLIQKKFDVNNIKYINQPQQYSSTKINDVLNYIDKEYVDTVNIDSIVEKTIPTILKELDPHSIYIPAKDVETVNEPLTGKFEGIGVQFNIQKDTITIIKTIFGGPSEKIGLKDGDRIVTINDSIVAGIKITNNKVIKLLRGKKGTKVNVGIYRRGEEKLLPFTITRDAIPLYSVDVSYMLNKKTGYIKISKFAASTYKEFQQAVIKLKKSGMENIIVDLRGNGGGFLNAAINIADEFLEKGKLIVYTEGRAREKTSYYSTNRELCANLKVTILIDEWSASASEIVSGAIQDNDRGLIIGRRSFGKGLVQEPVVFKDGSAMRLTIARYYTPSGRCIQRSYKDGEDAYYEDIYKRYTDGELLDKDSIVLPDSLKYYTTKGRVVYGGGGIMPDKFIPVDTSGVTDYLTKIRRKGLEYQFSFDFTDSNRKKLKSFKNLKDLEVYLSKQDLLNKFVKYASKKGVKENKNDIEVSGETIEIQIKALIARNIFDNDGFYPIIKDIDKTLLEAISLQ